ncbi:MAG: hypothetical protein PHT58_02895 [Eubacteriales bacterium]|nr:hypothetical protein [Eubacteriales bacterium]
MNILLQLHNSIKEGTAPHAVLLCGVPNGGQELAARQTAALFCNDTTDVSVLDNNPRYLELQPMKVGELRQRLNAFCMLGNSDGKRCMVLLDAHLCNEQSQNALLKTIEEPPVDTMFIIVGNEAGMLPTIRSRCTSVRLEAEPPETVEKRLIDSGVDPLMAQVCSLLSDGVQNRAAEMATEEYRSFRAEAIRLINETLFAATPFAEYNSLLSRSAEKGKKGISSAALGELFDIWLSLMRDGLLTAVQGGRICNGDSRDIVNKIASRFTISKIQCIIGVILDAQRMQTYQTSAPLTLDWVLAQCKG